jgi:hypothetical protein
MRAAVPTLRACQSLEEWIQVGRATPGHRLLTTRITALRMCRYEKEIRTASVCRSLRQRSEPKALEAAGALDATQDLPGLVATP